jgi:hypothetical protein
MNVLKKIRELSKNWDCFVPDELANEVVAVLQEAVTEKEQKEAQKLCFQFVFPIVKEWKVSKRWLQGIARDILQTDSLLPMAQLDAALQEKIFWQPSPEGAAHALHVYIKTLDVQIETARAFFGGNIERGMQKLQKLPEEARGEVDFWLLQKTEGTPINAADEEAQVLIAAALMRSLEQRMGITS